MKRGREKGGRRQTKVGWGECPREPQPQRTKAVLEGLPSAAPFPEWGWGKQAGGRFRRKLSTVAGVPLGTRSWGRVGAK